MGAPEAVKVVPGAAIRAATASTSGAPRTDRFPSTFVSAPIRVQARRKEGSSGQGAASVLGRRPPIEDDSP